MLVTWRYKERDTIIQRLDPRTRLIFMLCMMFALVQFWDLRFILFFLALALLQMVLARLTWEETRRFWFVITIIITVLSFFTAITGRGGVSIYTEDYPVPLWSGTFNLFGDPVTLRLSVERVTFMMSQIVRFFAFAALAVPIPFTIHPARYGIAFRRMGLPDKFAFATDLAFRFVPSLANDFQLTLDAQKARGYELERIGAGLVGQIRNMAPLMIPLIIGSVVRSEDIIDAMDLRGFGTQKRSWLEQLEMRPLDYIVIIFSVLVLLGATVLNLLEIGNFWVPEFMKALAG
ncbi:MAG: energy-coupling factor transporter transmembrane protein EcfT [Anaerolineales bacterium]|nr:energy-coupling factor transporter transmembrane protein EcfT [Anaerolineales bacterium]MCB0027929.1 energy-coupling factor transporter transmembrane protein EcfT [Anaerolineales bacterium]MCB8959208.1 energy-coupling factor transporter transmembrane protein EcfT [Ardenticatenales bacterium]